MSAGVRTQVVGGGGPCGAVSRSSRSSGCGVGGGVLGGGWLAGGAERRCVGESEWAEGLDEVVVVGGREDEAARASAGRGGWGEYRGRVRVGGWASWRWGVGGGMGLVLSASDAGGAGGLEELGGHAVRGGCGELRRCSVVRLGRARVRGSGYRVRREGVLSWRGEVAWGGDGGVAGEEGMKDVEGRGSDDG